MTDEEVQAVCTTESMIDLLDNAGVSLTINVSINIHSYDVICIANDYQQKH